jgi:uncharacterized protein with FMN-binding domain
VRRAVVAILSTAAGTTLLVGLKAGLLPLWAANANDPSAVDAATGDRRGGDSGADGSEQADDRDVDDSDAGPSLAAGATGGAPAPKASGPDGARPAASGPSPAKAPSKLRDGTFNGSVIHVKYGPVQVRVVIAAGRLTDVVSVQLPAGDEHSVEINRTAGPKLRQEALTAQTANIQTVSGATYTSTGYKTSLQAALDAAKQA